MRVLVNPELNVITIRMYGLSSSLLYLQLQLIPPTNNVKIKFIRSHTINPALSKTKAYRSSRSSATPLGTLTFRFFKALQYQNLSDRVMNILSHVALTRRARPFGTFLSDCLESVRKLLIRIPYNTKRKLTRT